MLPAFVASLGLALTTAAASPVAGYWTLDGQASDSRAIERLDHHDGAPCRGEIFELIEAPPVLLLPRKLTIAPGHHTVTIVDNCGNSRDFVTSGAAETVDYGSVVAQTSTRWSDRLLIQEIAIAPGTRIVLQYAATSDALVVTETVRASSLDTKTITYRYDSDAVR